MALARFKDLCMDASDTDELAEFWGNVLGRDVEHYGDGEAVILGDDPTDRLWFHESSQVKVVKHRVHLDLSVGSLDTLLDAGATVLADQDGHGIDWTVLADPDGGEFCAFVRDERDDDTAATTDRLVVDTADAQAAANLSAWWADVLGGTTIDHGDGWWSISDVEDFPFASFDMVTTGEDKQVKNRIHWDLFCDDVRELVERGAGLRRKPDVDIGWHVLVDPEGNEFCAFPSTPR